MGDKQCKIGIIRSPSRVFEGVTIRRHNAAMILHHNMARRVAAKRPYPSSNSCIKYKFPFIQIFIDLSHDDVRGFNPNAYVHLIVCHFQSSALQNVR
ncbi:hypothetical protein D3C76_1433670 [compost metagenome]